MGVARKFRPKKAHTFFGGKIDEDEKRVEFVFRFGKPGFGGPLQDISIILEQYLRDVERYFSLVKARAPSPSQRNLIDEILRDYINVGTNLIKSSGDVNRARIVANSIMDRARKLGSTIIETWSKGSTFSEAPLGGSCLYISSPYTEKGRFGSGTTIFTTTVSICRDPDGVLVPRKESLPIPDQPTPIQEPQFPAPSQPSPSPTTSTSSGGQKTCYDVNGINVCVDETKGIVTIGDLTYTIVDRRTGVAYGPVEVKFSDKNIISINPYMPRINTTIPAKCTKPTRILYTTEKGGAGLPKAYTYDGTTCHATLDLASNTNFRVYLLAPKIQYGGLII